MRNSSNEIVSVIIATRNIGGYLFLCLDSLKRQSYQTLEIIVIDNTLDHEFSKKVVKEHPEAKLYSSANALSYCESINKGIRVSHGRYLLCLNDDVTLDERFIEKALAGFDIDAKIGMVSGKILRKDAITIDSAGLFLSLWRSPRERGYGFKDKGQFNKEGYIFGVNGAAAFYRKQMLEATKVNSEYLDEDYHFFYEDLDVAWRARLLGWECYYIPEAVAYHIRGASVRQNAGINKPYARRYLKNELHLDLLKNRYLTLIKNERVIAFILHLPFILAYDVLAWAYVLFFRPVLMIKSFPVLKYMGRALNKRKIIKRMKNETAS